MKVVGSTSTWNSENIPSCSFTTNNQDVKQSSLHHFAHGAFTFGSVWLPIWEFTGSDSEQTDLSSNNWEASVLSFWLYMQFVKYSRALSVLGVAMSRNHLFVANNVGFERTDNPSRSIILLCCSDVVSLAKWCLVQSLNSPSRWKDFWCMRQPKQWSQITCWDYRLHKDKNQLCTLFTCLHFFRLTV